jgi:CheY-like chemotaxis protein
VEPSADEREVLRTALARRGMRIWEAAGTDAGLRLAREHHPDVIVLDLEAGAEGDESVSAQFGAQSAEQIAALIVLGRARYCRSLPQDQVIAKPYHFAMLVHKIEQLAAKAA